MSLAPASHLRTFCDVYRLADCSQRVEGRGKRVEGRGNSYRTHPAEAAAARRFATLAHEPPAGQALVPGRTQARNSTTDRAHGAQHSTGRTQQ